MTVLPAAPFLPLAAPALCPLGETADVAFFYHLKSIN
jgi:hypothetical protein